MALFQKSVLKQQLSYLDNDFLMPSWEQYSSYFLLQSKQEDILSKKESEYQTIFLQELFGKCLGYTLDSTNTTKQNLYREFKNKTDSKQADGAIKIEGEVICVIELKSSKTKELSKIEEQAFGYLTAQSNCKYVVTSNFRKLRFYIQNKTEFIEFDLFNLTKDEFKLLWLCLSFQSISSNLPLDLKNRSIVNEEKVTKQLYSDYSSFRQDLFNDILRNNPNCEQSVVLNKTQKLLDRILFILFAEDRGILPVNAISEILNNWESRKEFGDEVTLYMSFITYFNNIYKGRGHKDPNKVIFSYNGGLFNPDEDLDRLIISDEILLDYGKKLTTYDFESDISVNILGHIFEHSLNEIEELQNQIEGKEIDKSKSKRKKDGVFYTPQYITKYIVENTVGKLCEEKKNKLNIVEEEYLKGRKGRPKNKLESLRDILEDYRKWLLELTICDPACGSGAFLNQALEFLISEHNYIDELQNSLLGGGFKFPEVENSILENNLYGVDINKESVEIAKLSLWLRTAQKGRKLTSLNNNIKCGNSLIDDPEVAGEKAFHWENEFPDVFERGGFNVIIGNPPYGAKLSSNVKDYITKNYLSFQANCDIYTSFIELANRITNDSSFSGYIIPVSWQSGDNYYHTRKFISENLKLVIGIKLPYDVFKDAYVDTGIYVFQNFDSDSYNSRVIEFGIRDKFDTSLIEERNLKLLPSNFWMELESLKVVLNPFFYTLQPKIYKDTISLNDISDSIRGILPKTEDVSEIYKEGYKKYFIGYLGRYQISNDFSWVLYSDNLREKPKDYLYFQDERIIIRRLINRQFRIMASLVNEEFVNKKDIYNLKLTDGKFNVYYVIALLNSKLFSFIKTKGSTTASKDDFSQLTLSDIRTIPVKIISEEIQHNFKEYVNTILSLNEEFNLITDKFSQYFSGSVKIEKLTRKLENWHELDFSDFIKELNKAIKKAGGNKLTKSDEMEWMELFETKKSEAQNLKSEIDKTDKEIDQMVYELYGLTKEEIEIVENS